MPSSPESSAEPELADVLRRAAAEAHPLPMLDLVSSMLAAADPRNDDPFETTHEGPELEDVLATLVGIDRPETTVALHCVELLLDDEEVSRRVRDELGRRRHKPPRWLRRLEPVEVVETWGVVEPHGETEDVVVSLQTGAGHDITVVAQIHLLSGAMLSDAFAAPVPSSDIERSVRREPALRRVDLDPAEARACLEQALAVTAMTVPRVETDTWPMSRHLLEWVIRLLPEGGVGYELQEWTDDARDEVVADFLASPQADGLGEDAADIAGTLVWFAVDYGFSDPLRWTPSSVGYLLLDWLPRKVMADVAYLAQVPDVLRALVRFAASERDVEPELVADTLAAIDDFEDEYLDAVSRPRAMGATALLEGLGLPVDESEYVDPDLEAIFASRLDRLAAGVGGHDVLEELAVEPLPDEPLDLTGVADDVAEKVVEIGGLVDEVCDRLFDVETRTAARRLLGDVARADPAIFRRRSRSETAAAAVVWIVGSTNASFDAARGGVAVGDVMVALGLNGSPSQRAQVFLRAVGVDPDGEPWWYERLPGMLRYSTAEGRDGLVRTRDAALRRLGVL